MKTIPSERPWLKEGSKVEVSSKIAKMERVWGPAMIVREIVGENSEKKYIVKSFCCSKGDKAGPNKTVDLLSVRPIPPPFSVEKYQLGDYVEAFHGTVWREGNVINTLSQKRYVVLLESTELEFKHSDLRPLRVWEDGVWKTKQSPLTQASGSQMGSSETTSANNTSSLNAGTLPMGSDSRRENENSEANNRKRVREKSSEENKGNDSTMDLPFVKKSRIWKTLETMQVFQTIPQSPHFGPLVESRESSREMSAVGMMYMYSDLIEEVKSVQLFTPISRLEFLSDSCAELEKHGFDVKEPQSRIHKVLSLKDRQAKKMEELQGAEKVVAERESKKVEIEAKIFVLEWDKEEVESEIAQMQSYVVTIGQELEDVGLEFLKTVSAPW